jgi:hypothetical protein
MRGLACQRPYDEGEPFQRRCRGQHDTVQPQAIDHASDDCIATIGRGGDPQSQRSIDRTSARSKARRPRYASTSARCSRSVVARRIIGEVLGTATDLVGEQRQHGGRHRFTRQQASSQVAEVAELHRISEPLRPAPATRSVRRHRDRGCRAVRSLPDRAADRRSRCAGRGRVWFWTASTSCSSRNRKATLFTERRPQDRLCDIIVIDRRATPLRHADGRLCDNADRSRAGV